MLTASVAGALVLCTTVGTTPYRVDPAIDGVVTGAMLTFVAAEAWVVTPVLAGGLDCPLVPGGDYCDKARLNVIDRSVVGNDSASWRTASDIGLYSAFALPVVFTSLDAWLSDSSTPVADFGAETLVMTEALAVGMMFTDLTKFAIRRPRPAQYVPGRSGNSIDQQVSFMSGHTTETAAAAASYATTVWLKHPDSPARFVALGGAILVTGIVGYARVAGGMHFYSDVVTGAAVGGVIGWLIPLLHRADAVPACSVQMLPGGAAIAYRVEF